MDMSEITYLQVRGERALGCIVRGGGMWWKLGMIQCGVVIWDIRVL
jgi:hypothetical protein